MCTYGAAAGVRWRLTAGLAPTFTANWLSRRSRGCELLSAAVRARRAQTRAAARGEALQPLQSLVRAAAPPSSAARRRAPAARRRRQRRHRLGLKSSPQVAAAEVWLPPAALRAGPACRPAAATAQSRRTAFTVLVGPGRRRWAVPGCDQSMARAPCSSAARARLAAAAGGSAAQAVGFLRTAAPMKIRLSCGPAAAARRTLKTSSARLAQIPQLALMVGSPKARLRLITRRAFRPERRLQRTLFRDALLLVFRALPAS